MPRRPTVVAALVIALFALIGAARMSIADERRTVTVSASGSVTAEPDIVSVQTGVVTEGQTARDALTANNQAVAKLIAALGGAGIAKADMRTTGFRVEPRYNNGRDGKAPNVVGYLVVNDVRITVRDLKRLGDILDLAVTSGANQAGGIDFEVSRQDALKDEARRQAMAAAVRKATLYAEAARAELGKVLSITEGTEFQGPRPMAAGRVAMP